MPDAVFFDLDGTLADTAPDLAGALNRLRLEQDLPALPLDILRRHASKGARGLIGAGLGLQPESPGYAELVARFLEHYTAAICVETRLFPGVPDMLGMLDEQGIPWGIVTNKATRFTIPLLEALGLTSRAVSIVSGDTAARAKPHPDPLLHACREAAVAPDRCCYVGDDLRDILAGRAAGMRTIAVTYGYLGDGEPVERWGADALIGHPGELIDLIGRI